MAAPAAGPRRTAAGLAVELARASGHALSRALVLGLELRAIARRLVAIAVVRALLHRGPPFVLLFMGRWDVSIRGTLLWTGAARAGLVESGRAFRALGRGAVLAALRGPAVPGLWAARAAQNRGRTRGCRSPLGPAGPGGGPAEGRRGAAGGSVLCPSASRSRAIRPWAISGSRRRPCRPARSDPDPSQEREAPSAPRARKCRAVASSDSAAPSWERGTTG